MTSIPAGKRDHAVQLYADEDALVETVADFLAEGLHAGEPAIILATRDHARRFIERLVARGIDVARAQADDQLVSIDAAAALEAIVAGGEPDRDRFDATVTPHLDRLLAARGGEGIRAFGEAADLLVQGGDVDGALRLEAIWEDVIQTRAVKLHCAYSSKALSGHDPLHLAGVRRAHTRVIDHREPFHFPTHTEDALHLLVESVTDYAIFLLDPEGHVSSWNRGAEKIKGYRADEIIGRHFSLFYPEADVRSGKCARFLETAARAGRVEDEGWRVRKDGSRFWASVVITALRDEKGDLRGFGKVTRDLTERKRAEDAQRESETIRRSEERLGDFFENAPIGIHWVGPHGIILRANKAELELLGYAREEYIGRHIAEFHAEADKIDEMLRCLTTGGELHEYETTMRKKDGSVIHVSVSSNALWKEGRFVHTRCFTRDVTERKLAEAQLREADRRKDEFLAMLGHELRNPLAPITTALQLLRVRASGRAEMAAPLGVIERQTRHLTRLVDDLLEVSRITRGKIRLEKEPLDASVAVSRAIELARPLIDARRHRLEVSLPAEPVAVDADPTRLAQILGNLLNNAAKYTDPGGRIAVSVAKEGDHVVFRVKDDGIGIAPELFPRLFELFTQADTSLDRSQGGLGIGLTLVRGLVELHGGRVEARSEGRGRGSEFIVSLPATASAKVRSETPAPPPREPYPDARRIVVVDDNVDAAATLAEVLADDGHAVVVAHDGWTALQVVRQHAPEIVLLDIGLPRMDGYEVARELRREHGERLKLVALTGYGQDGDRRRAREAGFDHHLVKPLRIEELSAIVGAASRR